MTLIQRAVGSSRENQEEVERVSGNKSEGSQRWCMYMNERGMKKPLREKRRTYRTIRAKIKWNKINIIQSTLSCEIKCSSFLLLSAGKQQQLGSADECARCLMCKLCNSYNTNYAPGSSPLDSSMRVGCWFNIRQCNRCGSKLTSFILIVCTASDISLLIDFLSQFMLD